MVTRAGDAGPNLLTRKVTLVVPNITAGHVADVAAAADAAFADAGAVARLVTAALAAAPLANLGIVGAWVSNPTTGVVTVRFIAGVGDVATANQDVLISEATPG